MTLEEATQAILDKISYLLGCESEDVDFSSPLSDLGIDSLSAVELANW